MPDEVRIAQQVLDRVRDDLMSRPGVHAVYVGLLLDPQGAPTANVGIRVVVDPVAMEVDLDLPDSIDEVPLRLESGRPAPQEGQFPR